MSKNTTLLASAVAPPALAIGTALLLRGVWPPRAAYLAVWGVYLATLLLLCLTLVGRDRLLRAVQPSPARAGVRRAGAAVAMGVALGPALLVAPVSGPYLTAAQWAFVVALALVNAPLEELYWRGTFATGFPDLGRAVVWPTLAFTSWHVALVLIPGITVDGGAASLVGGAAALGLVWALVSWFTGTIRWAVVGHVAVNVAAFTGLVHANGFGT